jgi:hypothetical protein
MVETHGKIIDGEELEEKKELKILKKFSSLLNVFWII